MEAKDAVLILRRGKPTLALPGPEGYQIEWSPGTKFIPLSAAPSGHLVIPSDLYHNARSTRTEDQLAFITDHTNTTTKTTEDDICQSSDS